MENREARRKNQEKRERARVLNSETKEEKEGDGVRERLSREALHQESWKSSTILTAFCGKSHFVCHVEGAD